MLLLIVALFTIQLQRQEYLMPPGHIELPTQFQGPNLEQFLGSVIHNEAVPRASDGTRPLPGAEPQERSEAGSNSLEKPLTPSEIPVLPNQTGLEATNPSSDLETAVDNETHKLKYGDALVCLWSDDVYRKTLGKRTQDNPPRVWKDDGQDEVTMLSLDDCLDEFSLIEELDGEQAWFCPGCSHTVRANTSLHLWRVPEILILQLKRFDPARNRKVDVVVDYPVTSLDLTDRVGDKEWLREVSKGDRLIYDLFAVGNHSGGLYGGHYTATVCNYLDGNWYDFNGVCRSDSC
jgi:hypothetical protein